MKNRRSKLLIDKNNQLRAVISVVGINILAFLFIFCVLYAGSVYTQRHIDVQITQLSTAVKTESDIIRAFTRYAKSLHSEEYELATAKITKGHTQSVAVITDHISQLTAFIRYNRYLLAAVIVLQLLQSLILFWYMLKLSHRVAGPASVINALLMQLTHKKNISTRSLRKGDYLHEVHTNVITLADHYSSPESHTVSAQKRVSKNIKKSR